MRLTRRPGSGRGRLSLRSRLLAGLITVTALFLVIMGVVTTVVLGNSEQGQFNSDLVLSSRVKLSEVAGLTGGYAEAYINVPTRQVGVLSAPSAAASELATLLGICWPVDRRGRTSARTRIPRKRCSASPSRVPAADRDLAAGHRDRGRHSGGLLPPARACW